MSLGLSELMCLFEFGKGYLTAKQVTHCSYVLILVFCPKDYCFHPCLSIFSLIHLSVSVNLLNLVTLIRVQEDHKMQYIFWRYVSSCDLSEPNMGRMGLYFECQLYHRKDHCFGVWHDESLQTVWIYAKLPETMPLVWPIRTLLRMDSVRLYIVCWLTHCVPKMNIV